MLFCSCKFYLDEIFLYGKWLRNNSFLKYCHANSCFDTSFDQPNSRWTVHLWIVRLGSFIHSWCADTKNLFCAQCPPVNAHSSRSALTELRIDTIDIVKSLSKSDFFKWHHAHHATEAHYQLVLSWYSLSIAVVHIINTFFFLYCFEMYNEQLLHKFMFSKTYLFKR